MPSSLIGTTIVEETDELDDDEGKSDAYREDEDAEKSLDDIINTYSD